MQLVNQNVKLLTHINEYKVYRDLEEITRTAYSSKASNDIKDTKKFIKRIIKLKHFGMLEHYQVSFRIITNRAIANEIVRHRIASYLQASTRYIKLQGSIKFIKPAGLNVLELDVLKRGFREAEEAYFKLMELGIKPEVARDVLPLGLATEMVITMNLRSWLHYFELRTHKTAHPQIRQLSNTMLDILKKELPTIFENLT